MDGLLKSGQGMDIKLILVGDIWGVGVFVELKINSQEEQLILFNDFSVSRWCERKNIFRYFPVTVGVGINMYIFEKKICDSIKMINNLQMFQQEGFIIDPGMSIGAARMC